MSIPILRAWDLTITPLSPLHIGTGEDFDPTNYVIDGGNLYVFGAEAALRALPESARQDLMAVLDGRPDVQMIKQVQAFFHRHRERLIPGADHAMPVLPSIAAEYEQRVGRTAQREQGGREIVNQLRIERAYADPATRRPILPGSSLKGAIRTALLDRLNAGNGLTPNERDLRPQQQNRALQMRLFRYQQFDQDPMRLVQLSDAAAQIPGGLFGTEVRYAVNRKRQPVMKDGKELRAQAENLRQVLECVPPLRARTFTGRMVLQDVANLDSPKLPDQELRWTLSDLAAACNAFFRPVFEREQQELTKRGYLDNAWRDTASRVLAAFETALGKNEAFLLRIGRHSGAEAVTLNGVRSIKIIKGKGERPDYLPQAKTVWLAAREIQDRRHLVPFGWVLVEASPQGTPLGSLPDDLVKVLEAYGAEAQTWRQAVTARRAELTRRLEEAQAREEARRAAALRAEQEAREHAERLARLGPEARALEELRDRFREAKTAGRREPGGSLANQLAGLLKAAVEWGEVERRQLAELAEEIYGFIGWGSGKKKTEKKARVDALRR